MAQSGPAAPAAPPPKRSGPTPKRPAGAASNAPPPGAPSGKEDPRCDSLSSRRSSRRSRRRAIAASAPEEASSQPQPVALTLDDAVSQALENNLSVRVSRLGRAVFGFALSAARRAFTPDLTIDSNFLASLTPSSTQLDGAEQIESDTLNYNLQVNQTLPFGSNYTVSFNNNRFATNSVFSTFNPRYRSVLDATFNQPLLQNFLANPNQRQIVISRNGERQADHDFERAVLDVLRDVEIAYWDLAFAIRNQEVAQQSLELARDLLRNNQVQVEVGTLRADRRAHRRGGGRGAGGGADSRRRPDPGDRGHPQGSHPGSGLDGFLGGVARPGRRPHGGGLSDRRRRGRFRWALARRPELRSQRVAVDGGEYDVRFFRNTDPPADGSRGPGLQLTGIGGTELRREGFFGPATENDSAADTATPSTS